MVGKLPEDKIKLNKESHLKSGIGYFLAWLGVALVMFNEYKDNGGIEHLITSISNGDYSPLILVSVSIILLALAIKNIAHYFNPGTTNRSDTNNKN